MRIINTRQQFISDHSSTSYLFYAAKPLSKVGRAYVSTLSSHVDVGDRTAEITYHGDFADLGDARRKKFLEHYDIEIRESYDWWTLSVMLESEKLPKISLEKYAVEGEASLTFQKQGERIRLCFEGWRQNSGASYEDYGRDTTEGLAELGLKLRGEIYSGKTAGLEVMHHYCAEASILRDAKSPAAKALAKILEVV